MQDKIPQKFLSKNLIYIRKRLNYTINDLAEIVGMDPIDLYELEKFHDIPAIIIGNPESSESNDILHHLVSLANYIVCDLGHLVMYDLEQAGTLDDEFVNALLREQEFGEEFDRSHWYRAVYSIPVPQPPGNGTIQQLQCYTLSLAHHLCRTENRYQYLRRKGMISPNDFFEKG